MHTVPASDSTRAQLAHDIRASATDLGFDAVGITSVTPSEHAAFYQAWLDNGMHGTMSYLAREDAVRARIDPQQAWPAVRSAVVVAMHYSTPGDDATTDASCDGIIARYARGRDYHKTVKARLIALLRRVEALVGEELPAARAYVDTGPLFEREFAQRAGLGWFGRNTMLIDPRRGSWFFLATLLLDFELPADAPFVRDHCGTCSNCIAACPTGALLGRNEDGAPIMDATRCISYLTIENHGEIPRELRPLMGNRIFGCDICNEVCPWNGTKFVTLTREKDFTPRAANTSPKLVDLMAMDETAWDTFSQGSPVRRAKRAGFLRNVAVALGNYGEDDAIPALAHALHDNEPLVRGHAAWALGRISGEQAHTAVRGRLSIETDAWVISELQASLPG